MSIVSPDIAHRLRLAAAAPLIGAEVHTPLEQILEDEALQQDMRDALADRLVLVLPQASPTPDQQLSFSRMFGDIHPCESYNQPHPDTDEITVFDSANGYKADRWHSDATWREEVPIGATLCMRVCPSVGGDTMFANCYEAWNALSGGMKDLLRPRRAHHEIGPGNGTEHPVVIEHPTTGRPVLFVNRIFTRSIVNLPQEESEAVLPFLVQHVARPEFTYRHRWSQGDLLVWDNLAAQHYALFDFDERRVVDRVALGAVPLAASTIA
ncbi:MAG: TauD/TfdA dioxygenase family protein [Microthrixaceae bacterium]